MDKLFLIAIIISPFLLFATWVMTAKAKSFKKLFIAHTIIFVLYMVFVLNCSKLITGHDEYGLGQIGLAITFIIVHIVIGFVHGFYIYNKRKKIA